ncbi:MAG: CopG family transcriptional regulator [Deltaproteobacteria bacterium]|nr:CopG family transcriptional regulator [Deltaproteobacteria bacterium]
MPKKSVKPAHREKIAIEEIAERAESGEDVSAYFTGYYRAKQRVNIDFPLPLLQQIDGECQRLGVTREAWIKMACDERMRQIATRPRQRRAS